MSQQNIKSLLSTKNIGTIKENILEEPHRVFIAVPVTTIKQELCEEELPDNQDQTFSEEYTFSGINTVIKEDADVETESSCSLHSTSTAIKEEFVSEEVPNGEQADMCFTSGVSEETIVGCENDVDWSKHFQSDAQGLAQQNTTQKNSGTNFNCNVCNKTFISTNLLSKHKLIHSDVKKYQCDVCNKSFTTSSNLSRHKLIHSDIKKFKCDVCNKDFTRFSDLSRHKLIHSGTRKYTCDICCKSFTQAGSLTSHKLIHSGIKNYKCDVCNKAFTERGTLSTHKLIHSGIKRYKCDMCNKNFSRSSNLSRHKLIHSGIKIFKCDICNKAYSQSGKLLLHKLVHNGIKK